MPARCDPRRALVGRPGGAAAAACKTPGRLRACRGPCYASRVFTMRFSQRSATEDAAARADLYAATIDMCAWAENRGALAAILSQHLGSADGYLPSPVPLAAA